MIRKITVQLTILHFLFSSGATYNDKQMVKMMYEYFSRRKPSEGVLRFSMIFGLVLLLSLLMFTTFNDISRLVVFFKF